MQSILDREFVGRRLVEFGYAPQGAPEDHFASASDVELEEAVRRYQQWNGLVSDGIVGPETAALLNSPYRCGCPDMMAEAATLCRWPSLPRVTYGLSNSFEMPGLTRKQVESELKLACDSWNAVCGINLQPAQPSEHVNIAIRSEAMDGQGGTLAESFLPCGNVRANTTLNQRYDNRERWVIGMAQAVFAHEVGHAIGLSHLAAGNLLQPYYRASIKTPQAGDIREVLQRYGEPKKPTPPPVEPPPPADESMSVQIVLPSGRVYSGTLVSRSGR